MLYQYRITAKYLIISVIIEYVSMVTYSHKCTSYAVILERRTRL